MRPAEAERNAEALRVSDDDVRSKFAGGFQKRQGENVRGNDDQSIFLVRPGRKTGIVEYLPARCGILKQDAEYVLTQRAFSVIAHHDLDVLRLRPRAHHLDGLRMAVFRDEKLAPLVPARVHHHGHRLRRRRALIEQRGVGDLHAGEVHDHGLEIEQRFHAPLRDFRLIGRVRRVPARIFQDVSENHRRGVAIRIPHAEHRLEHLVPGRERTQIRESLLFCSGRGEIQLRPGNDGFRDGFFDQVVQGVQADFAQHRRNGFIARRDVAMDEFSPIFEILKRQASFRHECAPSVMGIQADTSLPLRLKGDDTPLAERRREPVRTNRLPPRCTPGKNRLPGDRSTPTRLSSPPESSNRLHTAPNSRVRVGLRAWCSPRRRRR